MHVTGRCEQLLRGKQGVSHLRLSSRVCVNYADVNSFIVISPVLDDVSKWTIDQVENLPHGYIFGEKKLDENTVVATSDRCQGRKRQKVSG